MFMSLVEFEAGEILLIHHQASKARRAGEKCR
jgi:hypothetical protein